MGYDKPMLKKREHADWFHGPDGMGNMNYPDAGGGSLIGWANDAGTVLSGYNNENKEEAKPQPSRQQSF